jgi:predicted DNA-binding WGR domain protein
LLTVESDAGGSFLVYNRWGRVGARGQQKLHGPFSTRDEAIYEFEGKFEDKTNNAWSNRKNFKFYAKKYAWLEMDYGEVDKETVSFDLSFITSFSPLLFLIVWYSILDSDSEERFHCRSDKSDKA